MEIKQLEVGKDILLSEVLERSGIVNDKNYRNIISGIYMLKNKINGVIYIGSSKDIYKRMLGHRRNTKGQKYPLYIAMRDYGLDSFYLNIVEECSLKLLSKREIFWIKNLNSRIPNGYNITGGGSGGSLGCKFSSESKRKMSESHTGKIIGDVQRERIGISVKKRWKEEGYLEAHTGENHHSYGKIRSAKVRESLSIGGRNMSLELRNKISEARRKSPYPNRRETNMIDVKTNKVIKKFESITNAIKWLKENEGYSYVGFKPIKRSDRNGSSAYGYKWKIGKAYEYGK